MIFGTAYAIAITLYTVPIQGHPHPAPPQQFCTEHYDGSPKQCVQIVPPQPKRTK